MSEENLSCSFCGLSKLQTKVLVAGQDAHICDQCIEQAFSILNHQNTSEDLTTLSDITDLSPCLLYTSPSPRDRTRSRMPSSA